MIRLYTAANLPDAHIVLNLLAQSGIEARVFNENAQGGLGEIPFTHTYPEVWLMDARDVRRAKQIVENYEKPTVEANPVACPVCGEENPKNFEICWHCGKPL